MPSPIRSKKARYSLDTVDRLFETAFATATRIPLPKAMKAKMEEAREANKPAQEPQTNLSDHPPASPTAVSSLHTAPMTPEDETPDALWDEVRRMKEKTLAKSPPKVKSVEQALSSSAAEVQPEKKPRLKRRTSHLRWVHALASLSHNRVLKRFENSPTFKESSDGQMVILVGLLGVMEEYRRAARFLDDRDVRDSRGAEARHACQLPIQAHHRHLANEKCQREDGRRSARARQTRSEAYAIHPSS